MTAVRRGWLYALNGDGISRQGPRIVEGAAAVCAVLDQVAGANAPGADTAAASGRRRRCGVAASLQRRRREVAPARDGADLAQRPLAPCRRSGRAGSASGARSAGTPPARARAAASRPRAACAPGASPVRLATRKMWVSTAIVGSPKAVLSTTLAVLRPTPGSASSASRVARHLAAVLARPGSRQVAITFFALVRNRPIVRIASSQRRPRRARASPAASARRANSARGRLVDAAVGGLRRQQHRDQQLEDAACTRARSPAPGWRRAAREERLDVGGLHARAGRRRAATSRSAALEARRRRRIARHRASRAGAARSAGAVARAQRASRSAPAQSRAVAAAARAAASRRLQASQPVRSPPRRRSRCSRPGRAAGTARSRCSRLGDHGVHALGRADDRIDRAGLEAAACSRCSRPRRSRASARGPSAPQAGSSGSGRPAEQARPGARSPSAPPGGQRLMSASPRGDRLGVGAAVRRSRSACTASAAARVEHARSAASASRRHRASSGARRVGDACAARRLARLAAARRAADARR